MSEIFEGVLFRGSREEVERLRNTLSSDLSLALDEIKDDFFLLYRDDPRSIAQFTERLDDVASDVSIITSVSVVIRYDSSIGHRSSKVFESGHMTASFDEDDEIFVSLDEDGMPIIDGPRYRLDELSLELEYETVKNAIELGLDTFRVVTWEELLRFIASH